MDFNWNITDANTERPDAGGACAVASFSAPVNGVNNSIPLPLPPSEGFLSAQSSARKCWERPGVNPGRRLRWVPWSLPTAPAGSRAMPACCEPLQSTTYERWLEARSLPLMWLLGQGLWCLPQRKWGTTWGGREQRPGCPCEDERGDDWRVLRTSPGCPQPVRSQEATPPAPGLQLRGLLLWLGEAGPLGAGARDA